MTPKVSVIIPIYNTEQYLPDALESVLKQTLHAIEIICVDDGSTDGSAALVMQYRQQDERITLLTKENGGLSSARNAGMQAAQGEYLLFLDSDDFYSSVHALEELYEKASSGKLDQLFFDAESFYEEEKLKKIAPAYTTYYNRKNDYPEIRSGRALFCEMQENWDYFPSACLQLLRRTFLREQQLFFIEDIRTHEDDVFTLKCCSLSARSGYLNKSFYARRVRAHSIMMKPDKTNSIYGYYYGVKALIRFAGEIALYEDADETFCYSYFCRIRAMEESAGSMWSSEALEHRRAIIQEIRPDDRADFDLNIRSWQYIADQSQELRDAHFLWVKFQHLKARIKGLPAVKVLCRRASRSD